MSEPAPVYVTCTDPRARIKYLGMAGYSALLADHCELHDRVAALVAAVTHLEQRIADLEGQDNHHA